MVGRAVASLAVDGAELTIDELATQTGMTVRNIRAHQSRGLLPAPRIVGRTGYYGPTHVRRVGQIQTMQERGLNLAAIALLVSDGRLTDTAVRPFTESADAPDRRPAGELADRLHLAPDDPAIGRALEMGLISVDGDEVVVAVPRLVRVAEQFTEQGVPLGAMLDAVAVVQAASRQVADAFMTLADEHLITQVALDTQGDLDQIRVAVERLRVQAGEALGSLFDQAMANAIRAYFASTAGPGEG